MAPSEHNDDRAAAQAAGGAATAQDGEASGIFDAAIAAGPTDLTLCKGEPVWLRTAQGYKPTGEKIGVREWAELIGRINPNSKARGVFDYADSRWRVSSYETSKGPVLEVRRVPRKRKTVKELGIPKAFLDVLMRRRGGLVLITGATNSGKTTTLGAVIDALNASQELKIEILDDPIENEFVNDRSFIKHLQFGDHFKSWQKAIEEAMNHDPDVIVVGEMRTKAAMQAAITAAETGHLVIGTLHTRTASGAIRRLTDSIKDQPDLLGQLADSFAAALAQELVTADGASRPGEWVTAYELLLRTDGVVSLIREGHPEKLANELATGGGVGMMLMDDALGELVKTKRLLPATAAGRATRRGDFLRRFAPELVKHPA